MKYWIIIACILLDSYSTMKIEEQIVQDFVREKKLKNIPYANASYLIKEAGSKDKILNNYKIGYLDTSLPINKKRIVFLPWAFKNWPIEINEANALISIHKKDSLPYYWSSKNFKTLDIPIIDRKDLFTKIKNASISIIATGHIVSKPI